MNLDNRTVLITGASSGLGHALALDLSKRNCRLIVTARRANLLEELAEQVRANGSECLVIPGDATDLDFAEGLVVQTVERFGTIDCAVLNAGGGKATSMRDASARDVLHFMRVNYDTVVSFLCPIRDHMMEKGGVIAYTGSPAGFFGLPKSGPYSASKAAGRILVDTCRIELKDTPIRFVAIYPGFTRTPGLDADEVPFEALIIEKDRAVREMVKAIEREKSHHMFPKRISWLMTLARVLPEWLRRRILGAVE